LTGGVEKITHRSDFDAVMATGVAARTAHFALHQQVNVDNPRIGAVVPKRLAKRAVTRNTIKRQIYATAFMRTNPSTAAHVVRLRKEFDRQFFKSATSVRLKQALREELQHLFAQVAPT
jgi:ribonuclease P protein component